MKTDIHVEPATTKLVREYYGENPLPKMRVYFLMDGDEFIGTAGFVRLLRDRYLMTSDSVPEKRQKYKVTIVKFAKMMIEQAHSNGWDLVAFADESLERSVHFLEYLGFVKAEDGSYVKWRRF